MRIISRERPARCFELIPEVVVAGFVAQTCSIKGEKYELLHKMWCQASRRQCLLY